MTQREAAHCPPGPPSISPHILGASDTRGSLGSFRRRVSLEKGEAGKSPTVPSTHCHEHPQGNSRSTTMATYFQSSTCGRDKGRLQGAEGRVLFSLFPLSQAPLSWPGPCRPLSTWRASSESEAESSAGNLWCLSGPQSTPTHPLSQPPLLHGIMEPLGAALDTKVRRKGLLMLHMRFKTKRLHISGAGTWRITRRLFSFPPQACQSWLHPRKT